MTGLVLVAAALSGVSCSGFGGPGCPSIYDGSYNGVLTYEWEEEDAGGGVSPQTGTVRTTVKFACDEVVGDMVHLSVTHAMADHPYFGCTLDGCVPDPLLSLARLPANPPASVPGKIAVYMETGNYYTQGVVNVLGGGDTISSEPGGGDVAWYGFGGATDFPDGERLVLKWKWTFTRSAL